VQLRFAGGDLSDEIAPALQGRWLDLPEKLGLDGLNTVAHMIDGYALASEHLGREAFEVAESVRRSFGETGVWKGSAVELLVTFFATVRGWRGLYGDPGPDEHREAQAIFEAVRRRLREHPEEVELVAAQPEPTSESADP
jgi:hypothetical protein